jgi:hypothetical protein
MGVPDYKVGQYIVYHNGDRYEIGRIKRLCSNGAFVCYSEGETAAKTPYDLMHHLVNEYCIQKTILGNNYFNN